MTRDEVFDFLARHGVAKVVIPFSGGGDEGTFESPQFFGPNDQEMTSPHRALADDEDAPQDDDYEQPFYDEYYSFDGPGIQGTVEWDVGRRVVIGDGSQEEWVDFGPEEI